MAEPNRLAAALSYEQDRPAFGNPSMLEQGRKMRERKQAEQVDRSAQKVKSDLLARALMYRYNPETLTGLTDTPGPQTLDEAAGLDPRVDRSTFLPYSQKEGLHVPAVAADLMKLATASNPQYSNLMQPEEAMPLATNMMGGGVVASRLAPAPAGSLGMNAIKKGSQEITSLVQQRNNPKSIISGIGDDLITLYHGTSKSAAEKIKNEGVIKSGSYFGDINGVSLTPRKSVAEDFANGGEIIEVKVPKSKLVVDPESVDNLNLDQAIRDGKSLFATGNIYFPAPNRNK